MAHDDKELTDSTGISEDVDVALSSERIEESHDRYMAQQEIMLVEEAERITGVEARRLPPRPSDSHNKDAWIDYCVALGATREDLEGETTYNVTGKGEAPDVLGEYVSPPYTKDELIELADRLGG